MTYVSYPRFLPDSYGLYQPVQRDHHGLGRRTAPSIIGQGLVQVDPADPVTILKLSVSVGRAQLGKGVEGDGPVAADTGFPGSGEEDDLLDARQGARRTSGRFCIVWAEPRGKDIHGAAGAVVGIWGYLDEVQEFGSAGSDVQVVIWRCGNRGCG